MKRIHLVFFFLFLGTLCSFAQKEYHNRLSSNNVSAIIEDSQGFLWVATSNGLNRFDGHTYIKFTAGEGQSALPNDNIGTLIMDGKKNIWIASESGLTELSSQGFRHPEHTSFMLYLQLEDFNDQELVSKNRDGIVTINKETFKETLRYTNANLPNFQFAYHPAQQTFWVYSNQRVQLLDQAFKPVKEFTFQTDIRSLIPYSNKEVWALTATGLSMLELKGGEIVEKTNALTRFCQGKRVLFLQTNAAGLVAVGIQHQGIYWYDPQTQLITLASPKQQLHRDSYVCFMDRKGNIWLSNKTTELLFYPYQKSYETILLNNLGVQNSYVLTIKADKDNNLWMRTFGTDFLGLDPKTNTVFLTLKGTFGEFIIDRQNTLWLIQNNTVKHYAIAHHSLTLEKEYVFEQAISSICEDQQGQIWVVSDAKIARLKTDGSISWIKAPADVQINALYEALPARDLIITTHNQGLFKLVNGNLEAFNAPVKSPTYFYHEEGKEFLIASNNEGVIFYDEKTGKTSQLNIANNLSENHVKTIQKDQLGNFWFGCPGSINRMNPETRAISHVYDTNFQENSGYAGSCIAPDGTLYFGGNGGITVLHPDNVSFQAQQEEHIPILLDLVEVNGQQMKLTPDQQLSLNYQENTLTFWYTALDLENGSHLNYAYMLKGYDKDWISAGMTHRATYSTLPAGNYVFKVRVRLQNGEWDTQELEVPFTIHPALWATWWAKLIYLLLALAAIAAALRLYLNWKLQKDRLQLAHQRESMKQEQIDFVTNISHEFRTPLSLIYAPLKQLVKKNTFSEQDQYLLQLMERNSNRLLHLSEQILDVQVLKKNQRLAVEESNLSQFLQLMAEGFQFVAHEKDLDLRAHIQSDVIAWFDREKVEKICCNLISNAVKYTPDGGTVDISFQVHDGKAIFSVKDNGMGISKENQKQLFARFNRLDVDKIATEIEGHGIGLNYSHYLALRHKGTLRYEENTPQGSIFTFTFPCQKTDFLPEELVQLEDHDADQLEIAVPIPESTTEVKEYTILLAEDNYDVRQYIATLLQPTYNIIHAGDGEEALECLKMNIPDLVITDVIMPQKNGFELCSEIKSQEEYSHVPVMILTAKSEVANQVKGLDCGADAYVSKPFNPEYLLAMTKSLIENRARVQHLIKNTTSATLSELDEQQTQDQQPILLERDRKFMEQLYKIIDEHLDENELNVQQLAKELFVSYSFLYNKLKSLTGETPQHFLTTYRMNKAMELIKSQKYTVSEVSYMVGSSSLANFSKAFKKQFGMSPSGVNK